MRDTLPVVLGLSIGVFGCGSSDDGSSPSTLSGGAGGSGGVGITTACGISTGFSGDDLCIQPPDPSVGFQMHYGPEAYDAESVKPFLLPPGAETTDCFWLKTPNTGEVYLSEYHARMRPGSHHMIVTAESVNTADGLASCEFGGASRLIVGSSTASKDFPDPGIVVPENDGLALKLEANTEISFQMHYINSTSEPILREAWVNFVYKDPSTVTTLVDPLFQMAGLGTAILPHTDHLTKGSCTAPADLRIVEVHGHYHAHTTRMSAWRVSGAERTLIYESYDWHEPASLQYDSGHQNSPPDPTNLTAGGYDGVLEFKKGDTMEFECQVHNDGEDTLRFTNQVYKGEMCILSGNYAPSFGGTWACENF